MYDYLICKKSDRAIFYKQCEILEEKMPELTRNQLLRDVDDSLIQVYVLGDKEVKVIDDHCFPSVRIESDIDLNEIF